MSIKNLLIKAKKQEISRMEIYAKGKRGVIYRQDNVCVKEKNPSSAVDTLKNEAEHLQVLNKKGIGPRFIKYSDGKLYREFVDGIRISDFFEQENDKEKIISVIKQVLEQCRAMDLLSINKKELTNPYKDIIITADNRAVMIDFERCTQTKKPKNVTQFLQYIIKNKPLLEKKRIYINREELIKLGRKYKEKGDEEKFQSIITTM
jgi:predicted Ser/Thr protein kinase